jgi:NADH:ubiquinone oxidoreductase subunit C
MKDLLIAICLTLVASCLPDSASAQAQAQAQEPAQEPAPEPVDVIELCGDFGELSDTIFDLRNQGHPMTAVLRGLQESTEHEQHEETFSVIVGMVRDVYGQPMIQSPEVQAHQKAQHRARVERECFDMFGR